MHVTTLASPSSAPAAARTAATADTPAESDFGAIYEPRGETHSAPDGKRPQSTRDKASEAAEADDEGSGPANGTAPVTQDRSVAGDPPGAGEAEAPQTEHAQIAPEATLRDLAEDAETTDAAALAAIEMQESRKLAVSDEPTATGAPGPRNRAEPGSGPDGATKLAPGSQEHVKHAASVAPVQAEDAVSSPAHGEPTRAAPSGANALLLPADQGTAMAGEALPADHVVVRRVHADADDPSSAGKSVDTPGDSATTELKPPKTVAPVETAARPGAEQARPEVAEAGLADVAPAEGRSSHDQAARVEASVRTETPRPVMQQLADAARALRDGPVELTMQPEELGKVRMTLSAGADGAMTMSLQAERPETLDLLRRHIGELARELQDMGFGNLNFSFGRGHAQAEHRGGAHGVEDGSDRPVAAVPLVQHRFVDRPVQPGLDGGLDLRL